MPEPDARLAVETVFRMERARLVAGLARMTRDVDSAEELAQEALAAALAEWPKTGVPDRPGAWLMTFGKRRAIDGMRRVKMLEGKHVEILSGLDEPDEAEAARRDEALDDEVGDELLTLMFVACHPVLSREARAALTLRLIGGLSPAEIARGFLSNEKTIQQRIVRAKIKLREEGDAYETPRGEERRARLSSVLEVVYLIFNEGYAATSGEDLLRPSMCLEALRLGRVLVGLAPEESEAFGLLSLMEIQASRLAARVAPDGAPIPITEQNRARWDRMLIRRGLAALARARALGGGEGFYVMQAEIAAHHARAANAANTDWAAIAASYDAFCAAHPSPVAALNRAVAWSMAAGPEAGLALLAPLEKVGAIASYAPLSAAKGDFLCRAGRLTEARAAFERAAALTANQREKAFFMARAANCGAG